MHLGEFTGFPPKGRGVDGDTAFYLQKSGPARGKLWYLVKAKGQWTTIGQVGTGLVKSADLDSVAWSKVSKTGSSLGDLATRAWADLSKSGSDLADLETRSYNDLQDLPAPSTAVISGPHALQLNGLQPNPQNLVTLPASTSAPILITDCWARVDAIMSGPSPYFNVGFPGSSNAFLNHVPAGATGFHGNDITLSATIRGPSLFDTTNDGQLQYYRATNLTVQATVSTVGMSTGTVYVWLRYIQLSTS